MGGIAKAVGKIVKGVAKAVGKVVKGVIKVAKKVVGTFGKVFGKLGPLGSIALGFILPGVGNFLAGSSTGWVSAIGKGIQTVTSALKAPFKIVGKAGADLLGGIGKGLTNAGFETIGGGFSSVSDSLNTFLGGTGQSVGEYAKDVIGGVTDAWTDTLGGAASEANSSLISEGSSAIDSTSELATGEAGQAVGAEAASSSAEAVKSAGAAEAAQGATTEGGNLLGKPPTTQAGYLSEESFYDNAIQDPAVSEVVTNQGVDFNSQQHRMLLEQEYGDPFFDPDKVGSGYDADLAFGNETEYKIGALQNETVEALRDPSASFGLSDTSSYNWGEGLKSLFSGSDSSGFDPLAGLPSVDTGGYTPLAGEGLGFDPFGGAGKNANNVQTGVYTPEEYARLGQRIFSFEDRLARRTGGA